MAAPGTAVSAPQNLRPFRMGTRQRMQQFATVPINLGSQAVVELPRVGFLAGILINMSGTVNLSAGGTLSAEAGPAVFKRIKVNVNTGAATLFDCSGFGTAVVNATMLKPMYNPFNTDIYKVPVNSGANQWEQSYYIPLAINDGLQFLLGLINLQAPEIRCTLEITFAASGAEFVSNFTSIVGTVNCSYVYYEVPQPANTMFPPFVVHRILEERQSITSAGDQVYTVPRGGTLLQLVHVVTLNGLKATLQQGFVNQSNLIDNMRLVLNKTDTMYNIPARAQALWELLKNPLSPLFFNWNLYDSGVTGVGEGDFRDTLDSEAISVLESILTVNSGATIGSTSFLDSIRRIFQPLQA
jgi:hypothetical protein